MTEDFEAARGLRAKLFAAAELFWLVLLLALTIWGPAWTGVRWWNIAAAMLFPASIVCSLWRRRPGWKRSGFRFDNVVPALLYLVPAAAAFLLLIWLVTGVPPSPPWIEPDRLIRSIGFGVLQQAIMLGYFLQRWQTVFSKPVPAALANAVCFGLLHLPDLFFAGLTIAAELIFTWLFFRARNVLMIGVVHGVVALAILPIMVDANLMPTARVGPKLSAIGKSIEASTARSEQVAICSRFISHAHFDRAQQDLPRIFRRGSDPADIRRNLAAFLDQERAAMCVITERELHRYLDPARRERLGIVAERFVWRDPGNRPALFRPDPILGFFRDRVLLVANDRRR